MRSCVPFMKLAAGQTTNGSSKQRKPLRVKYATEKLLGSSSRPTAVMCSRDVIALGVLRALNRFEVSVPEQMSIIGFDDIHLAEFIGPPLTSIRVRRRDLASKALNMLRCMIETTRQQIPRNDFEVSTDFPMGSALRESCSQARV